MPRLPKGSLTTLRNWIKGSSAERFSVSPRRTRRCEKFVGPVSTTDDVVRMTVAQRQVPIWRLDLRFVCCHPPFDHFPDWSRRKCIVR